MLSCTELASRARAVLSTSYKWRLFADDVLCIKDCIDRDVAALLRGHHARAVSALITLSAVAPSPSVPFIQLTIQIRATRPSSRAQYICRFVVHGSSIAKPLSCLL